MKNKVFYVHIPKTAGTTVASLLDEHFNNTIHHIEGKGLSREALDKYDVVSGHITYTAIDRLLDLSNWTTIATFREPYSHIASHIRWIRKLAEESEVNIFNRVPKEFQELALFMKTLDFSHTKEIKKLVNYLIESNFLYMHNTQTLYMDSDKSIENAISNMNKINIIGLTESIDHFYSYLHTYFDWSLPKEEVKAKNLNINNNKYQIDILDEKTRATLYPLVNKDIVLYEEAMRLVKLQSDN